MLKYVMALIVLAAVYSCMDNTDRKTAKFSANSSNEKETKILQLEFPDTVLLKENIQGRIKYGLYLDSLRPSDISSRYIFFHVATSSDKKGLSLEEIKKENRIVYEDTIGKGVFHFEVIFPHVGDNVLNGIIEDIRILNGQVEDKDKVRIVTKETSISRNIYVKDSL